MKLEKGERELESGRPQDEKSKRKTETEAATEGF